jgi:hypothetical protein
MAWSKNFAFILMAAKTSRMAAETKSECFQVQLSENRVPN